MQRIKGVDELEKGGNKYLDIRISKPFDHVLLIVLDRPKAKNALRNKTLMEISQALEEHKSQVKCVVITGSKEVFAAGADINELKTLNPISSLENPRAQYWRVIRHFPMPIIAAVNGYALGAGCELAMHCDIVIAGDNAKFGQPEVKLGVIPGAGGTQRLTRSVGKSNAMKMVLTGQTINANQALSMNLVSDVVVEDQVVESALDLAISIAKLPPLAVRLAKQSILNAYETGLETALEFERQSFSILAASKDRERGIKAFLEKQPAKFTGD